MIGPMQCASRRVRDIVSLLLCGLLVIAVAQLANAQINDNKIYMGQQSSASSLPVPHDPTVVGPRLRFPPDFLYESLHDPWFNRHPWGSPTSEGISKPARKAFEHGFKLLWKHKPEMAEKEFRKSLELDPAPARTWDYLGRSLQQQAKIDDARAAMERAITVDPDYMLPITGLIELENTAHRTQNAVQLSDSIVLAAERSAATVDVHDLVHKRADGMESRPSRSFINLIRFERSRLEVAASQAYLDAGQSKKCIAAAREAYLLDRTSLKVALLFTVIIVREGKIEAAKTLLHRYLDSEASGNDKKQARKKLAELASNATAGSGSTTSQNAAQ